MKNTYVDTMAEIARLRAVAEQLRKSEVPEVISRIRQAIDAYGFNASDLGLSVGTSPSASQVKRAPAKPPTAKPLSSPIGVAKYRDPKSGKTWTGRGKPPTWIAGAKNRESFAVAAVPTALPAAEKAAKAPNPPKPASTVGEPKYRDPTSGKTWTGRGKPPNWIATAKNRDDFAIAASAGNDSSSLSELTTSS